MYKYYIGIEANTIDELFGKINIYNLIDKSYMPDYEYKILKMYVDTTKSNIHMRKKTIHYVEKLISDQYGFNISKDLHLSKRDEKYIFGKFIIAEKTEDYANNFDNINIRYDLLLKLFPRESRKFVNIISVC